MTGAHDAQATVEELAEDMVHVLEAIRGLGDGQAELSTRLEELAGAHRQQAVELGTLRRDLLGDRRAHANRAAFDAIHPAIDQIRAIHDGLGDGAAGTKLQLSAVISSLRVLLQGLGFVEFVVEVDEPFDPTRMECVAYADGEPGVVLAVVRPGFRTNGAVVRPCGVLIADPALGEGT
jgi:molecular chaperone GrpE